MPTNSKEGTVRLADGSVLKLKATIIDAREAGFSPFGGVNIAVKSIGGVGVVEIPKKLRDEVSNKPFIPSGPEPPRDGWEIIEIVEYNPAIEEITVNTSRGTYLVRVETEPVMVARNMNYKTELHEPYYWLSWVSKASWKLKEGEKCQ